MTDATLAKPWLTQYPPSIPAEIDVSAYANLPEMLEVSRTKYADRVAFHCSGTDATYRELDRLSTALPT
jgi:long-chain acyl-CoA synthetase